MERLRFIAVDLLKISEYYKLSEINQISIFYDQYLEIFNKYFYLLDKERRVT